MSNFTKFLSGWEIKKVIISPIIVNLITATILFFIVCFFKNPILQFFGVKNEIEDYPILCIAEPYNSEKNEVFADLYIINLEPNKKVTKGDLINLAKIDAGNEDRVVDWTIKIKMKNNVDGEILDIEYDTEFNRGKGNIEKSVNLGDGSWKITIIKIEENAIMKLYVYTNYKKKITSRASRLFVPFTIDYPGRKWNF